MTLRSIPMEQTWRLLYTSIFNPARLKLNALQSEMPKKYWRNLPEAALIKTLSGASHDRTQRMLTTPGRESGRLPIKPRFKREQWLAEKHATPHPVDCEF